MIIDITGTVLTPGNFGKDCKGNGENGNKLLCDECDFLLCCIENCDCKKCKLNCSKK